MPHTAYLNMEKDKFQIFLEKSLNKCAYIVRVGKEFLNKTQIKGTKPTGKD